MATSVFRVILIFAGLKIPGILKLKAPHFNRRAGAKALLLRFAINCSPGIEPALHDGLPGATGAGNHAQENGDGGYFVDAPKGYLPPREQDDRTEASSSAEVAEVPWRGRFPVVARIVHAHP
jgi:hypothetical protein